MYYQRKLSKCTQPFIKVKGSRHKPSKLIPWKYKDETRNSDYSQVWREVLPEKQV